MEGNASMSPLENRGPDNVESMHVIFGSAHVTRASASTLGDLLDNPNDDEVHEVEKKSLGCQVF
jgi:hypothetical protein